MQLVITTTLDLGEANEDLGFVTGLRAKVVRLKDDRAKPGTIGGVRAALLHLGAIDEAGASLLDVLDADSAELEALHAVYFDDEGALNERFRHGAGSDLLYVAEVNIAPAWCERGVELAVVRRLCDTLGAGCELAVTPYTDAAEADLWCSMGFEITRRPSDKERGYLHLVLAFRQPRVADPNDEERFKVLPNPRPGDAPHH